MNDDSLLRQKAREALLSGRLPRRPPDQMWGGPATGARCAVCSGTTRAGDVELEIEFARPDGASPLNYHVHLKCFSILDDERQKLSRIGICASADPWPASVSGMAGGHRGT